MLPNAGNRRVLRPAYAISWYVFTVLPWTPDVAEVYGDLRAQFEASSVPLVQMDMMIAAHAKTLDLVVLKGGDTAMLITTDRAFWRVPGVDRRKVVTTMKLKLSLRC